MPEIRISNYYDIFSQKKFPRNGDIYKNIEQVRNWY